MQKLIRYIIPSVGLFSALLFCVSATVGIADASGTITQTFSEPINMLLVGMGLIGVGSFIKRKYIRG